jgi:N-acetylglucosamine-6-phosphate deacetylase
MTASGELGGAERKCGCPALWEGAGEGVSSGPPPTGLTALHAARLFTGEELRQDAVLLIEHGHVRDVTTAPPPGVPVERLSSDLLLAPGFLDLQVNGGGGVLFNDSPTTETLRAIAAAHRRFGTTGLMATLITDTPAKMRAAAQAVRSAGDPAILGLHLEGPFLNPARKGVHDQSLIRAPNEEDLRFLCQEAPRPLMVTLAPEMTGIETIARLIRHGVLVCIGHSAASYELAHAGLEAGARGFTHLFNAMPPLAGRDPGVLGAALTAPPPVIAGIIADGHHVHPTNLRLAFRLRGASGLALVTDAMASIGSDLDSFTLQGRPVRAFGGRLTTVDGTLAGAHLDMASAVRNAVGLMGAPLEDALRMATVTPAAFLGLSDRGRLVPGARADAVALTDALEPARAWAAGIPS